MGRNSILIAEGDEDLGLLIQHALKSAGHEAVLATEGAQAVALCETLSPGMIIADFLFAVEGGASFVEQVRASQKTKALPILILTSVPKDIVSRNVALDDGTRYLAKPYRKDVLLETVASILAGPSARPTKAAGATPAGQSTILVVEDDRDIVAYIKHSLETDGHTVVEAFDGLQAQRLLGLAAPPPDGGAVKPDLIILDIILPIVDGYTLGTQLRENPATAGIPVLVLTARRGIKELFQGSSNIAAVLDKPLDAPSLKRHVAQVLAQRR
jgi:DNA-binding response OmpR family regulator